MLSILNSYNLAQDLEEPKVEYPTNGRMDAISKKKAFKWSDVKARHRYSPSFCAPEESTSYPMKERRIINRVPPTLHFLNSKKEDKEACAYLKQYQDELPMEDIIQMEKIHLDSHVPVYTAVSKPVFLIQTLSSKLVSLADLDMTSSPERLPHQITWLRNPLAKVPKSISPDAQSYLYLRDKKVLDNSEIASWNLISCNPHLFGNVFNDAMESTVDYWWDNTNVSPPSLERIVEEMFETTELGLVKQDNFTENLKKTLDILNSKGTEDRGVIFQMFVPHEEVNRTIYISGPNGRPDEKHPDALSSLISIQHKPAESIPNYASMQLRLMAGRWMNPAVVADYRTVTHSDVSMEKMRDFDLAVENLVFELER